jgi:pimeloyl-ACP methyl ester carboxylesterase
MPLRKQFKYQNKQLCYQVIGSSPQVLLVHGFGEDGTVWENQFEAFTGCQLIIPDLPGSGASEMIEDMSMEGLAEALKHLTDLELNNNEFIMIGHSMGGYITLAFVEKYPERVAGFGLFHSTAFADNEEKIATRKKGIEFIKTNGAIAFLKTSIPNLYAPVTKEQKPELIEQHIHSGQRFTNAALIAYYESMVQRPDRTQILKQTKVPVLFVMGRHDTAIPLQDGLQQAHMPQLSYIHILENSGHMGMIEEINKANTMLKEFLAIIPNNV